MRSPETIEYASGEKGDRKGRPYADISNIPAAHFAEKAVL